MNNIQRSARVFEILRDRIVFAEYLPGQVLPIRELEKDLGVSATPIREALLRLAEEDLVRLVPNSSAHVKEITFYDLKDIFELRLILAEPLASLAVERIDDKGLAKIHELLKKISHAKEPIDVIRLDAKLHDALYEAAGNHALAKVARSARDQITRLWLIVKNDKDVFSAMVDDWADLYSALKDRDRNKCADVLRKHVIKFIDKVKDSIGNHR